MSVEIQLSNPLPAPTCQGCQNFRVSFEVSTAAYLLLMQAPRDLVLFAKPKKPDEVQLVPKEVTHGRYWADLFGHKGLGYCVPLKLHLRLRADATSDQLAAALRLEFGVASLGKVSPSQFTSWLVQTGLAHKVPC